MRKFLGWTGALLFMVSLVWGAWWSWPILFPAASSGWLSILSKADAALLQNRPDLARTILEPLPKQLPVNGWLQWEKRVHSVATQTQAWTWASQVAATAQAQYPGNIDLTAYLVWTLLQDQKASEAVVWARKVLKGTSWDGLAIQAEVESLGLASGDWSALKNSLTEPSPDSLVLYERLSNVVDDPGIRKNALLTALSQGRLDAARQYLNVLTPEQRDLAPFDRLQGLMAYDQGDWSRAAALLKTLAHGQKENLLVLADVYLHLGDQAQATIIYDQLLADYPAELPLVLGVNRATLALDQNDPVAALKLLNRVVEVHPFEGAEKTRLLILEARFRLGETEAVRTTLDQILDQGEGSESTLSLEAELLKGRLFPEWVSVPRLWSLLHRHADFSPLAERLTWLLLVGQDYPGAHRVLDIHERSLKALGQESPWWSRQLRALILAGEDRLVEASQAFESVPSAWRDATFWANWSLTSLVQAQKTGVDDRKIFLDDALEKLSRALDILSPGSEPLALQRRSLWLTRRGELQSSLVPFQNPAQRGALRSAAVEDFRQAVDLDPENLRALFLLRQAESDKQEKS